ncbi:uncharacterized protein [Eleutherodactylus coqui]|uniref:uncharacterized protein n=1 Tax=Eleutherodactylus coqui TaxID=57060 RepID=UPI003462F4CB
MSKYVNEVTKRILNITFEIIYLLTGEDYTIMKRTLSDGATPNSHLHGSGEWSRGQSPITEAPPHLPIHEQKIVELTNKITELLTGEVPIRCQDVAVYFSMEEWEYLEEQKDLYEDVMMENHQPHKSQAKLFEFHQTPKPTGETSMKTCNRHLLRGPPGCHVKQTEPRNRITEGPFRTPEQHSGTFKCCCQNCLPVKTQYNVIPWYYTILCERSNNHKLKPSMGT